MRRPGGGARRSKTGSGPHVRGQRRPAATATSAEFVIDSLAHGGDGVARVDGRVLFVPGGVPGDQIEAHEVRWLGGGSYGRVTRFEVRVASPLRQPASCPQRPQCGGCPWHEIESAARALAKIESAIVQLQRIAGIDATAVPRVLVDPAVPRWGAGSHSIVRADPEWGYRLRARLHVASDGQRVHAGYRGGRSDRIADIASCGLLLPALGQATASALDLARRHRWPAGQLHVAAGLAPAATGAVFVAQRSAALEPVSADLRNAGFDHVEVASPGTAAEQPDPAHTLRGVIAPETAGGPFGHDALTFAQVHGQGNRHLVDAVARCAAEVAPRQTLELHAGAGNLTLRLVDTGTRVRAVEVDKRALWHLAGNLEQASTADLVSVVEGDAAVLEQVLDVSTQRTELLVLDPPRTGYPQLEVLCSNLSPDRIIYCSCDVATLARDVRPLAALGYRLTRFDSIDMMPGTWHCELLAVFDR